MTTRLIEDIRKYHCHHGLKGHTDLYLKYRRVIELSFRPEHLVRLRHTTRPLPDLRPFEQDLWDPLFLLQTLFGVLT
jgi:hypothetical protein